MTQCPTPSPPAPLPQGGEGSDARPCVESVIIQLEVPVMFLRLYGDTEGPLGFPMKDADAKSLDEILRQHPDAEYCRVVVRKATSELAEGERADVSWIQTEAIDHEREIVLASGFRDANYAANPIVTINHQYFRPPIGKSLWRRRLKEGDRRGVKA